MRNRSMPAREGGKQTQHSSYIAAQLRVQHSRRMCSGVVLGVLLSWSLSLYLGPVKIIHFIQCTLQALYGFFPKIFRLLFKCN